MKKSFKGKVDVEKQMVEKPPSVRKMYEEGYAGRTKTAYDQSRGVKIITDKVEDPYKGVSKKSKLEGGLDNTTAFDKKAYQRLRDE